MISDDANGEREGREAWRECLNCANMSWNNRIESNTSNGRKINKDLELEWEWKNRSFAVTGNERHRMDKKSDSKMVSSLSDWQVPGTRGIADKICFLRSGFSLTEYSEPAAWRMQDLNNSGTFLILQNEDISLVRSRRFCDGIPNQWVLPRQHPCKLG